MFINFRFSLFIITIIFSNSISAQKIILSNPANNYLLYDLENPIEYLTADLDCNKVSFKIINAEFSKYEDCKLLVRPTNKESVTIKAYIDGKLIDSKVFSVQILKPNITLHSPYIEGKFNYNLADKLVVDFDEYRIDLPIKIEQYEMIIIDKDKIVHRKVYYSSIFDEHQKEYLSKLIKGDLIIFKDIVFKNIYSPKYNKIIKLKVFEVN